jgi:hypothetical protein
MCISRSVPAALASFIVMVCAACSSSLWPATPWRPCARLEMGWCGSNRWFLEPIPKNKPNGPLFQPTKSFWLRGSETREPMAPGVRPDGVVAIAAQLWANRKGLACATSVEEIAARLGGEHLVSSMEPTHHPHSNPCCRRDLRASVPLSLRAKLRCPVHKEPRSRRRVRAGRLAAMSMSSRRSSPPLTMRLQHRHACTL